MGCACGKNSDPYKKKTKGSGKNKPENQDVILIFKR